MEEYAVTMLGSWTVTATPLTARAVRNTELILHLSAWACLITAVILDGRAVGFDPSREVAEWKPYRWRHTTADAVLVSFVAAICAATTAINRMPSWGLLASVASCAACVAKSAMLHERLGGLRATCAIFTAVATGLLALAMLLQTLRERHRRMARTLLLQQMDVETSGAPDDATRFGEGVIPPNTYASRGADGKGRGASIGRLVSLARPERCLIIIATVALVGSTLAQAAMPALVGKLLTIITDSKETSPQAALAAVTIELIVVFGVGSVFSMIRGWLFTLAGERVAARLRKALFSQILSLEVSFFDEAKTGELLNRLSSDTSALQNAVTVNVSMGLRFVAQLLISIGAVFVLQWSLTLVML